MAKYVPVSFKLSESDAEHLRAMGSAAGSTADAMRGLIACGLAWKMTEYRKPVSAKWLKHRLNWDSMIQMAEEFRDAVAGELGLQGARWNKYRFVLVPDGTEYSEPGRQTYVVLRQGWGLDADGQEYMLPIPTPSEASTMEDAETAVETYCRANGVAVDGWWDSFLEETEEQVGMTMGMFGGLEWATMIRIIREYPKE